MNPSAPQAADVAPQIPGYTVVEQLYLGSRTAVYRAVQTVPQRSVVIKVLRKDYPSFSELVQFRNQYTIAKNLPIPGIIPPLSLEPLNSGYALVMEDCGGIALGQYLERHELHWSEVVTIALPLVETLHELAQHRVVHKDIKPANILIHPLSKQVKLIDFSIASLLPKEVQESQSPSSLEGTLAYLAPEQTGRMNRGIDYRTDFYSLGVTLYQLLTGILPFTAADPLELVHCHIAKVAVPVHQVKAAVPEPVSAIVAKLMAKNAEDRYQSALGLKHDLERCLTQWQETSAIAPFALGMRDLSDRFLIPEKLYGREAEVQTLLHAFDRVAAGASELMLVAGFSGIGKTAVVNEVHKPMARGARVANVRQRGYFIKGKYDQFNRNIPFSAFVQAFRDLMGQLLSESDQQLQQWKDNILSALGENGQVLIEVIPELEQMIGKQLPAPELSGSAAQNRFNRLFSQFIQMFTTSEHPLVLFLDDLQWADSASLNLMQVLLSSTEQGCLFMMGAYRDNEVFPAHPLMLTLEELQKAGAKINTLTLNPLSQNHVNDLIADTLNCSLVLALPLTELVYQKTKGNPFFTTQFLKALHEEGYITFEPQAGHWQCDITQVRSLALTDDVVEFMALQLQKLPAATQTVLKLAACIGAQFDLHTLAIVSEHSQPDVATALWKALQEGLILPISETYKFFQSADLETSAPEIAVSYRFLHDRVQQAAYSLIPDEQKQTTHLKIGQLLLQNTAAEAIESSIFDIINQLNQGISLIDQPSERYKLAQLNLIAGRKAKTSTAYKAAIKYLTLGRELLLEDCWETHYTLTFKLHRECAECGYLVGRFEQAEQLFNLALSQTHDQFAQADIYGIQMYLKMTQGENIAAALESGFKGLSVMGLNLPSTAEAQNAAVVSELEKLNAKLAAIETADLLNLPEMTDPVKKICMSLLADLWAAAYMEGNPHLSYLAPLLMVSLSLNYGNAESSGFAYCLYGMNLANQGRYQTAYEFGSLALKLDRHFNSTQFIFKTNNIFAHTINPYNRHLKTNLSLSQESFQVCQEVGNLVFGVWAVSFLIWAMLIKGTYLPDVYAETEKYLNYVQQVNDSNMLYTFTLQRQFLLHLQGISKNTDLLDNPAEQTHSNSPYIETWRQKRNFEHGINWFCFLKLQLAYFYGCYEEAIAAASEAEETLAANAGFFPIIQYHFYYPLSLVAVYPTASAEQKTCSWEKLQQQQQMLKTWADSCPENFLHRYLLLSAEMARVSGHRVEVSEVYDRAIAAARTNKYINEEALANELAAKFYLEWGKERIAQEYMIEAYYGYAHWGAKAKVADLEQRYPQLLASILQQQRSPLSVNETVFTMGAVTSTSSSASVSDTLDLATILKASQTLSSEIELDKLLSALLHTITQAAGADKCVLMLLEDDLLMVQAVAELKASGQIEAEVYPTAQPVEDSSELPISVVNTVRRSLQPAVITDATAHPQFTGNAYIQTHPIRSILCSPILQQGKLLGLVYLENSLVAGAFTRDRIELLNLLCAQAAISLENSRLYRQVQQSLEAARLMQFSIDRVTTPVCWVEPDGRIAYANDALCQDWGYPRQEIVGRYVYDFNPSFSRETWAEHWQEIRQQGSVTAETQIRNKAGKLYPVEITVNYIAFKQQEYHLTFIANISDRKRAEATMLQKTQELEQALQDLQQAQLQMIQSEKMSALGNLVAGVAHEINNPVGFIAGNLQPALEYVKDTFGLLELYQQEYPKPSAVIQAEIEAIDLDYIREDLPKLLDSMQLGVDRIRGISKSLRTFSRDDKDYKVPFNLHEGIDSTILMLKHRLKDNGDRPAIEVLTEYGHLPQIECFPGQLNQVFMNILANAIDMFDEMSQAQSLEQLPTNSLRITIQTERLGNQVLISIRDNGKGINEVAQTKIFDHLFTTKAVGKGTGLGLAIARQIVVDKHGGSLEVQSTVGQGSEFCIRLPIGVK